MADVNTNLFSNDKPVPCRIELSEWSGPVSPSHQYEIDVLLTAGDDGIVLDHREDAGSDAVGKTRTVKQEVPRETYETFMTEILALDPFSFSAITGADRTSRDGGSESRLTLQLGDQQLRLTYSPALLARGEHPQHQRLVSLIKTFVERLPNM